VKTYYTSAYNIPQRELGLKQHEKLLQELQGAYSDWKSQMMACCSVGKQHASPQHAIPHSPLWTTNVKQIRVPSVLLYGGQDTNIWKHNKYLRKTNESPATNLLEVTNVLHPVVSKCLLGWPVNFIICEWWFVFYQPITCAVSLVVQDIAIERYQFLSKLKNNTYRWKAHKNPLPLKICLNRHS
jgi:hypothetical protein